MQRLLCALAAFAVTGALVATAEDAKPAQPAQPVQPKAVQPKVQPVQPLPIRPGTVTAARMAQLEEDFEALEAHRDVKKAVVKAAEIAVRGSEIGMVRAKALFEKGALTKEEMDKATLEVEMAKAQLEIRVAEMKEVDVKVKHAKKRLDDAKLGGVRPAPGVIRPVPVDPKAVDPLPNVRFAADEKAVEELKAKLAEAKAAVAAKAAAKKKADAVLVEAQAELARALDIAMRGRVTPDFIPSREAKVKEAKDAVAKAEKELKDAEAKAADLAKQLKEIEK
jgi:multidrug resistance efflux pump